MENQSLILDLIEWVDKRPRTYDEVMAVWRTSCPRLPIWEDACDHGLLERKHTQGTAAIVRLTRSGRQFLSSERGMKA